MSTDPLTAGVASGLSNTIASLVEKWGSAAAGTAKKNFDKGRVALQGGFEKYLEQTKLRCSKVKTLIHRYDPVSIESAYVPVDMRSGKSIINADNLVGLGEDVVHATISGIAGSGKSMTLKYVYLSACQFNYGYIPIFVELRDIDFDQQDIQSSINAILEPFIGSLHGDALKFGLQRGSFLFCLMDLTKFLERRGKRRKEKF